MRTCDVDGCGRRHFGLGYCQAHHRRFRLYGSPTAGQRSFRGEGVAWLYANASHTSDMCLPWPFGCREAGYGQVTFNGTPMRASRAMCIIAHGLPPHEKPEAAHSCGNPICANPNHLRWASPAENTADKWTHGTMLMGEKCNGAKLKPSDVRKIRRLAGKWSQDKIASHFGISQSNVNSVIHRRTWRHV